MHVNWYPMLAAENSKIVKCVLQMHSLGSLNLYRVVYYLFYTPTRRRREKMTVDFYQLSIDASNVPVRPGDNGAKTLAGIACGHNWSPPPLWYNRYSYHILVSICPVLLFDLISALQPLVGDGIPVDGGVENRAGTLPRHHDGGVVLSVGLYVLWLWAARWKKTHKWKEMILNTCVSKTLSSLKVQKTTGSGKASTYK